MLYRHSLLFRDIVSLALQPRWTGIQTIKNRLSLESSVSNSSYNPWPFTVC